MHTTWQAPKQHMAPHTSPASILTCSQFVCRLPCTAQVSQTCLLLQEEETAPTNMGPDALMRQKISQKRHREGYEEGVTILYRPVSALQFIASDNPVQMLGQYSRCVLDLGRCFTACDGMEVSQGGPEQGAGS